MYIFPANTIYTKKTGFNCFAVWCFQPLYNKEGKMLR